MRPDPLFLPDWIPSPLLPVLLAACPILSEPSPPLLLPQSPSLEKPNTMVEGALTLDSGFSQGKGI